MKELGNPNRICNIITSFHQAKAPHPYLLSSCTCNNYHSHQQVNTYAPDLRNISSPPSRSHQSARSPDKVKWVKPAHGYIKVNCDVCLTCTDSWGIGVISRTDSGSVATAGTWMRIGFWCAGTAEARGMY